MPKKKKIFNYINKQKIKNKNKSFMVTSCVCGDVVGALRETKGSIRRVTGGYGSVLVFYSGWAGLCLVQGPN